MKLLGRLPVIIGWGIAAGTHWSHTGMWLGGVIGIGGTLAVLLGYWWKSGLPLGAYLRLLNRS
jgi:hypothetical protein